MDSLSRTENQVLMAQARESLKGNWGLAIGAFLIIIAVNIIQAIPIIGSIICILITGALTLGYAIFTLALSRGKNPNIPMLFEGFQKFGLALGTYILQLVFVLLWMLLLIVPGIIAAISYSLTFYLIADNKSSSPLDAITKSKQLMDGNKWKFFCLLCRFIGWALLCILTLGIGFLWLVPYISVSVAKFYEDVIGQEATVI